MQNVLALLADWANGIFALFAAAHITQTEVLWWFVPIALLISHIPDIDAVPELMRRGKVSASAEHMSDHRTFLHHPIISVPLALTGGWLFGFWGWVVCFAIILHLLNDLYGTGWGVPVLWPITSRRYKIFGRRVNRLYVHLIESGEWQKLPEKERKLRFVVSWSPEELPEYITRWGQDDWISLWYLRCNWISVIEYLLFAVACSLMFVVFF